MANEQKLSVEDFFRLGNEAAAKTAALRDTVAGPANDEDVIEGEFTPVP
ncbi:MAG: hypothetical protein H0W65_04280 [Sphingomonas sp.]|nr:hypothetical protein [Sphingomonas sp.]MBA3666923.1 hypothetical protein [Sphingomonas sp.]